MPPARPPPTAGLHRARLSVYLTTYLPYAHRYGQVVGSDIGTECVLARDGKIPSGEDVVIIRGKHSSVNGVVSFKPLRIKGCVCC